MRYQRVKLKKVQFIRPLLLDRKEIYRNDGSKVQFDKNAVVLTDDKDQPIGTRIFGPVTEN